MESKKEPAALGATRERLGEWVKNVATPGCNQPADAVVPSGGKDTTYEVREELQQELWLKAKQWVEAHSDRETWRVARVTRSGFYYDGPFFAPQFMSWESVELVNFDHLAGFAAE